MIISYITLIYLTNIILKLLKKNEIINRLISLCCLYNYSYYRDNVA